MLRKTRKWTLASSWGAAPHGWMAKNQIKNIWGLHENIVHVAFVGYQGLHCDGHEDRDLSVVRQRHCRQVGVLSQEQEDPSSCRWEAPEDVFIYQTFPSGPICRPPWRPDQKVFESLANKSKWGKSRLPHWNPHLTLTFHIFHSFHQSIFVQQHNWHICWLSKLSPFISKIKEEVTQLSS